VLRSYDSRFSPTNRSSEIYLSPECRNIVGEDVTKVLHLLPEDATDTATDTANSNELDGLDGLGLTNSTLFNNQLFWDKSNGRPLLVIATPYRPGGHVAKKPKAFLPIIDQLEKLHERGFVHGDIRAFNPVFGEQEDQGWLIDFDFGGKLGTGTSYPEGYRNKLADGERIGDGEHQSEILKWHDWYASGRLIFEIHQLEAPDGQDEELARSGWLITKMAKFWQKRTADKAKARTDIAKARIVAMAKLWLFRDTDPPLEEIAKLKNMLCDLDEQEWTVRPSPLFTIELQKTTVGAIAINRRAAGSPPEKNRV
jgi:hypothetical protein